MRAFEEPLRAIWLYTRAMSNLAPTMFAGYPRYAPGSYEPPVIGAETRELSEMPRILSPDDNRVSTATTPRPSWCRGLDWYVYPAGCERNFEDGVGMTGNVRGT